MIYRRKIDNGTIENANRSHLDALGCCRKIVEAYDDDPKRDDRLEECLCVACFYNTSRIGGARCTSQQCAFCDTVLYSRNTNVDILCHDCARKTGLCRHCGCDLDLTNRRKRELPTPTPPLEK